MFILPVISPADPVKWICGYPKDVLESYCLLTLDPAFRYGFDSYPGGFDCSNPSNLGELANYYVSGHQAVAPWGPMYLPEFQGQ
jgi:hypothetical protein